MALLGLEGALKHYYYYNQHGRLPSKSPHSQLADGGSPRHISNGPLGRSMNNCVLRACQAVLPQRYTAESFGRIVTLHCGCSQPDRAATMHVKSTTCSRVVT